MYLCFINGFFIEKSASCGGVTHHVLETLNVILLEHTAQVVQLAFKERELMEKRGFIDEEKLAPHILVESCDTGEVAEESPV